MIKKGPIKKYVYEALSGTAAVITVSTVKKRRVNNSTGVYITHEVNKNNIGWSSQNGE